MRVRALVLAGFGLLGTNLPAAGAESPLGVPVARGARPGPFSALLEPVRALAAERLGTGACRTLFELVRDFTGRPVARRLELAERSPSSHFARISFQEAEGGPCSEDGIAAWSSPGNMHVHLCGRLFRDVAARDRREAAAILIHEALHTLGVEEDGARLPLTEFVREKCGL